MMSSTNIPQIRIGIIQSAEQIAFRCDHDFHFIDLIGNIRLQGQASREYTLRIGTSRPAKLHYQVRLGIFKDSAQANQMIDALKKQNISAGLRQVGLKIVFKDRVIDNRDYWVIAGKYPSVPDAEKFLQTHPSFEDATIVEEISEKATGKIWCDDRAMGDRVRIVPQQSAAFIHVDHVPIGIEFHWQREESLKYRGLLEVGFNNKAKLEAINEIDIENYLASVNSSEMTSDCPLALLEAQTIAARSTVLATMGKHHYNTEYHLCSDDHCQCYHGSTKEQEISVRAMKNTFGELLMYGDEVCDARYSKICGGIIENYRYVWDDRNIPYLVEGIDSEEKIDFPADTEEKAIALIDDQPPVFCNTQLHKLPEKLANLYSTQNLFRWEVVYTREELEKIISDKLHINLGELKDIKPLSRGASGRLIYIELIGSEKRIKIGKELAIRRALSKSHLYSSCFYVQKKFSSDGKVGQFILKGAGWGHGVGLCQVGATVMALKGYSYQDILKHYFKNISIERVY